MRRILFSTLLLLACGLHAEVKLPAVFSDGMVLQQQQLVRVWGTGPSDIYVVEERGALWHFDGVAWTLEVVPGAREPRLIWGTPAGELFLAGACIQHRVPTEP